MFLGLVRRVCFRDGFDEVADVEVVLGEVLVEAVHGGEAEAVGGLLDEVVEEVFDEGAVGAGAFDGDLGEVGGAVDANRFVVRGGVVAGRVDGLLLFVGAEASDGVVVFQAEANRVDDRVAGHAAAVLGDFGDFLPHGEIGLEIGVFELDGIRRRLEEAAEDVAAQINAAMDGRGLFVVGERGEHVRMRKKSGTMLVGRDIGEAPLGCFFPVKLSEAFVDGELAGEEELAVVGLFGPDDLFDEKSQRGAEVGDDVFVEAGEGFEIFAEVVFFSEVEPGEEEAVELLLGARVIEHLIDALIDLVFVSQVTIAGSIEESAVWNGIPEGESEF